MFQLAIIATKIALLGEPTVEGLDPEGVTCLATNIYHEARGESLVGQYAVAYVTLNRVAAEPFPESICDVVYQKKQFSWTAAKGLKIDEPGAYQLALLVALTAMTGLGQDPTGGATFYYDHSRVTPNWSRVFKTTAVIGGHTFQTNEG